MQPAQGTALLICAGPSGCASWLCAPTAAEVERGFLCSLGVLGDSTFCSAPGPVGGAFSLVSSLAPGHFLWLSPVLGGGSVPVCFPRAV